jgi:HSP20 family protein
MVIRVEIPGMRDEEFNLSMDQNILTITGNRIDRIEDRSFHQMEVHFGPFIIQVEIATEVAIEKAEAEYVDGFLWVYLPKNVPHPIEINLNK